MIITLAVEVFVLTRVMRMGYDTTIMAICFGSPLVILLYFLLKYLLRALAGG